ncbi:hypothetical protein [Polymorphum gilvum]|nr:hypothetical protein [Polymorphum gilvum]
MTILDFVSAAFRAVARALCRAAMIDGIVVCRNTLAPAGFPEAKRILGCL